MACAAARVDASWIKANKALCQFIIVSLAELREGVTPHRGMGLAHEVNFFGPEIEKTARRLRKETKQLKGEASTSSTSKAGFELNLPTSSESEEEVMAQNLERMINEMTSPNLNQQPLCIEYPTLDVDFELKSGLIHLLPTFHGLAGEDPHKHLEEFHVVCFGMRPQGVTEEQVKLRAVPLGDKAKIDFLTFGNHC
ncbi:UNVERIFIED_CONTAM: hypothetical protein Scaly_2661400 [Sesamum calycinum]|uniref:Reverse transcriptase domain-containing protein n=1 Tax=Sesamum calycinum TaxID=2727403 RepID=A0AAW2JA77_9LAMI